MSRSLTTEVGLLSVSRATGQILNALVGLIIVRFLAQADYGTFRQIYLLFFTLVAVADLGLIESLYYFLPSYPEQGKRIVRRVVLLVGGIAIIAGLLMVLFAARIGQFFHNPELTRYVGALALAVGFGSVSRAWDIQLIAERRIPLVSVVILGFEVLKCGLMVLAVVGHKGIWGLMWAVIVAALLKLVSYAVFLARESRPLTVAGSGSLPVSSLFTYAMGLWVPGVLAFLSTQVHQYIVGHYYGPEDYAIYAVACFQVPFIGLLAASIGDVFLVRATQFWARRQVAEVYGLWLNTCRKAMTLFMPIAISMAVLAKPLIVLLFTRRYETSAPLFAIIVLGLIFSALFQDSVFRASNAMVTYSAFHISRGVLGTALGIVGVKYWGLWGAAVSVVAVLLLVNSAQLFLVARQFTVGLGRILPWRDFGKVALANLISAALTALVVQRLASPVLAVIVGLVLFWLVYVLLLGALGMVTFEQMRSLLRRTRADVREFGLLRAKAN